MLLENFKLIDSIGIELDGVYLDLHSNFDFVKLSYDIDGRCVEFDWNKNAGDWAHKEQFERLKLIFKSVDIFCVHPRDSEKPFSEDDCLSYIGYLHPDDLSLMNGFLPPEQSEENYHMILGFESGLVVKIFSKSVVLLAKSPMCQGSCRLN